MSRESGARSALRPPIGVVIVDDQQIVLAGVAALVAAEPGMYVAGTSADVPAATDLINGVSPDVVLCDIQLEDESGLLLLERFGNGRPPVIMLSSFEHRAYYQAAMERGAAGYILKSAVVDQLVEAIKVVAAGGIAFPASALRPHPATRAPSRRELEVIRLVAEGASNDEVAAQLAISAKTVDSHLRALFDRYGAVSRTDLAMRAVANGWLRQRPAGGLPQPAGARARWLIDERIIRARSTESR